MTNWIKKEIEFESNTSISECKRLTLELFNRLGFKNSSERTFSLYFERGSEFQNGFTKTPLKWMSKIKIVFQNENEHIKVSGNFDINTINQLVTPKELEIWSLLIENFKKSILSGKTELVELSARNKIVQNSSLGIMISTIIGALIGGGIGMYLAFITDLLFLIPLLTIAFALIFLIIGIRGKNNGLQHRQLNNS